jgi:hypothetical protein
MNISKTFQIIRRSIAATLILTAVAVAKQPSTPHSQWVYLDHSGKLVYKHFKTGDRIIDFSYAGYMGGGVAIPIISVTRTVSPSGKDDTAAIQAAIDEVSSLPLVNRSRGAVLLKPGHFHCSAPLKITASGVVLRGSGSGETGTIIDLTGDPHLGISISGTSSITPMSTPTTMADDYVPSGAMSFSVRNVSNLKPGDSIQIVRPVTTEWLHFMGMDALVRNSKKETWVSGNLTTQRTIVSVTGNTLHFDVPLTDSYDAKYLGPSGATVIKVRHTGQIEQVGVEDLRIVAPALKSTLSGHHFNAMQIRSAEDSWVRNLRIIDTTEAVSAGQGTRRITIDRVDVTQSVPIVGHAKPADFSIGGTQILINRCTATGDNVFYIATGPREQGPNVVLNCVFRGDGHVQPHQRWATGLLVDSCRVPEGGIDFMNRGEMGSGHGWAMGWGVAWNNVAKSYLIQMPPGSANWSIGNRGEQTERTMPTYNPGPPLPMQPQGIIESQGEPVAPASLYLEQLSERLGPQALKNIGY